MRQVGQVTAEDFMDDGTPIRLTVTIDRPARSAIFDFEGTVRQALGLRHHLASLGAGVCSVPDPSVTLTDEAYARS